MKKEYRCQNIFPHMCHGPLYLVVHKRRQKVFCFELIKNLIRLGHDINIIKNVPRTDILKEKERSYRYLHFFYKPRFKKT